MNSGDERIVSKASANPTFISLLAACAATIAVLAAFAASAWAASFPDVSRGDWYAEYVDYVSGRGLMSGYADGRFAPEDSVTRGMVATVLYRYATGDSGSGGQVTRFPDVEKGAWYTAPVEWCRANGVVTGYDDGRFGPKDPVTREQLATMMYRFAGMYGAAAGGGSVSMFPDASSISSWAVSGVAWCNSAGIMTGDGTTGRCNPQDYATRAQLAKMLTVLVGSAIEGGSVPTPSPAQTDISKATVTLSQTSYTYDGSAKKPTVAVKLGYKTLTEGTDYAVSYSGNVSAGTATVTVTGKGNYAGSVKKTFTIAKADISKATVTLGTSSYTYDGSAKKPAVTVKLGGATLSGTADYTVSYSGNVSAGTATVTVTGKGNYSGSAKKTFIIAKADISKATVTLTSSSYTYDGSAKTPGATVKLAGRTLVAGTDYTVFYSGNVSAGTATATITGKGNYTGTAKTTFTIAKADISSAEVALSQVGYTYDGEAKEPTATVRLDGKTLLAGSDYVMRYVNNHEVGFETALAIVNGTGNYSGSVVAHFSINMPVGVVGPISVANAHISVVEACTYDGTAKEPAVEVSVGGKTLVQGSDYSAEYSNNIAAGTAIVTITGKGGYTGTVSAQFSIAKADISVSEVTLSLTSCVYDGSAHTPGVTVKLGGKTLASGTDYVVSYTNNVSAGTATATVTGRGNYQRTATKTFVIEKASLSDATVSVTQAGLVYDGTAKKPVVTVMLGGTTLSLGSDYTVSYSNNVNYGTASVTVTGVGSYSGSIRKTFSIAQADVSGATVTFDVSSYTYDGSAKTPGVTVKLAGRTITAGADYTVSYSGNVDAGTATATVTGKGNYTGTAKATFTVAKADISNATVTLGASSYIYDGTAKTPAVTVKLGSKTLSSTVDYTVSYANNVNAGVATVTVAGKGNYKGTATATFTIAPAAAVDISSARVTFSPASCTYDGSAKTPAVTVKLAGKTLLAGTDYTVSYSSNVDAGTATVTISGAGGYTGEKSASFTIAPADISVASVTLSKTSYSYSGSAIKPGATVRLAGKTLVSGTDFSISYTNNVDIGIATVTVSGKGNYTGTVLATFTITPYVIPSDKDLSIALGYSTAVYTGSPITPSTTVFLGSKSLRLGVDYDVVYENNVMPGTATVTVTCKGNLVGSGSKTFRIDQATIASSDVTVSGEYLEYDGTPKEPAVTVVVAGAVLVQGVDYDLVYSNNVMPGTGGASGSLALVTVTGKGGYTGTASRNFTVNYIPLANGTVEVLESQVEYDGTDKKPGLLVTVYGRELAADKDYIVTYTNNRAIGQATATVRGIGVYGGTATATFQIVAPPIAIVSPGAESSQLTVGDQFYLYTNYPIMVAESSDDGVLSVVYTAGDSYALIRALAVGEASIIVWGEDGSGAQMVFSVDSGAMGYALEAIEEEAE